jgi:hypothetical protein
LDVDLDTCENMGLRNEARQKKIIAPVELVDISGVKDVFGGVSKATKTFQEEKKSIGNMDNLLKNEKDMVGTNGSNSSFNVSNRGGRDLKDVNGEKEKSGAKGSVDSGRNEISGDKSKTISSGGNQSSGGENNFLVVLTALVVFVMERWI